MWTAGVSVVTEPEPRLGGKPPAQGTWPQALCMLVAGPYNVRGHGAGGPSGPRRHFTTGLWHEKEHKIRGAGNICQHKSQMLTFGVNLVHPHYPHHTLFFVGHFPPSLCTLQHFQTKCTQNGLNHAQNIPQLSKKRTFPPHGNWWLPVLCKLKALHSPSLPNPYLWLTKDTLIECSNLAAYLKTKPNLLTPSTPNGPMVHKLQNPNWK